MADPIHMEVKKHAIRQTLDGWVVSFVVHPNDIDPIFAVAPLGTRYMLAIAQIGDDEQPIAPGPTQAVAPDNGAYQAPLGTRRALSIDHGKGDNPAPNSHREMVTDMVAARIRAVLLCKDERFQRWVMPPPLTEARAAENLRRECHIASRAEIATNHDAYMRFIALEGRYKVATGLTAEQRGYHAR